jgi:hypothetical protein
LYKIKKLCGSVVLWFILSKHVTYRVIFYLRGAEKKMNHSFIDVLNYKVKKLGDLCDSLFYSKQACHLSCNFLPQRRREKDEPFFY